jgi:glycosyltransferase involved in cell wall biosynthesis
VTSNYKTVQADAWGKENSPIELSACMMVKNEEEMLPGCLESIKDHVDELVIVDTGSTDRTVEIANAFGARLFHHPWEHDFSKHRNQSISYARGRWIFIIDADEVLAPSTVRCLKDEIALADEKGIDSLVMKVENVMSQGNETVCNDSIRLFVNKDAIRYDGIVHNNLTGFSNPGASLSRIIHYGYDKGRGIAEKKFERTATLLRKQIVENPASAAAHMYLSSSYASLDMFEGSLKEGIIAVDLVESQNITNKTYVRAYYDVIRTLILSKRYDEAEHYCSRAIGRFGDQIDILAARTMIAFEKKEWERVLEYGSRYLNHLDRYRNGTGTSEMVHVATYGDAWKIYGWMGSANLKRECTDEAERLFRRALESATDRGAVSRHAGLALVSAGLLDSALPYLEHAYALAGEKKDSRVVEALFKIGITKGDRLRAARLRADALAMEDLSVSWCMELADFAARYGDIESALIFYSEVSKIDESNVAARLQAARLLLSQGWIEEMIGCCDRILQILALPRDIAVTSFSDLADLFAGIADELRRNNIPGDGLAHLISAHIATLEGHGAPVREDRS